MRMRAGCTHALGGHELPLLQRPPRRNLQKRVAA